MLKYILKVLILLLPWSACAQCFDTINYITKLFEGDLAEKMILLGIQPDTFSESQLLFNEDSLILSNTSYPSFKYTEEIQSSSGDVNIFINGNYYSYFSLHPNDRELELISNSEKLTPINEYLCKYYKYQDKNNGTIYEVWVPLNKNEYKTFYNKKYLYRRYFFPDGIAFKVLRNYKGNIAEMTIVEFLPCSK